MENENASQVPLYSIEGIINVLKDLSIKVTEKELKKPSVILFILSFFLLYYFNNFKKNIIKPDVVAMIYKELLSQFIHVKPELLNTDQQDLALNFNEETLKLQSDSFKILQFYVIMLVLYIKTIKQNKFNFYFFKLGDIGMNYAE